MSHIITRSGRVIDVLNPRIEDIDIDDIAHALSNLCRWCGQPDDAAKEEQDER